MRRALVIAGLLGVAALAMAARPGSEWQLVQQLNGQPVRFRIADGGRSGVFTTYDGGAANAMGCMPLTGATTIINGSTSQAISPNVLLLVPSANVSVCVRPSSVSPSWDGGCNYAYPMDENLGVPLSAGVPQYITPDNGARWLCAASDAGYVQMPVWWAQ